MVLFIILRSEQGVFGLFIAIAIHFGIYICVFANVWCVSQIKRITDQVKKLKEAQAGTYRALELHDASPIDAAESVKNYFASDLSKNITPLAEDCQYIIEEDDRD